MLTEWRAVKSDGSIADLPARAFQYRYNIAEFVPLDGIGIDYTNIVMRWRVRIETAAGGTIFRQTVITPLDIVSLGVPGMELYTWWVRESVIVTEVCGGELPLGVLTANVSATDTELPWRAITAGWPAAGEAYILDQAYEQASYEHYGDGVLLRLRRGLTGVPGRYPAGTPVYLCSPYQGSAVLAQPLEPDETVAFISDVLGTWPVDGAEIVFGPPVEVARRQERIAYAARTDTALLLVHRGVYGGASSHPAGAVTRLAPETVGAEQGAFSPAGSSDYTDVAIYLLTTWLGPVYLLNVPAGSRFRIDFHNVGLYKLRPKLAAIETRIERGAPAWLFVHEHGAWVQAQAGRDGKLTVSGGADWTGQGISYRAAPPPVKGGHVAGNAPVELSGTVLLRPRGTMRVLAVGEAKGSLAIAGSLSEGIGRWSGPVELQTRGTVIAATLTAAADRIVALVQSSGGTVQVVSVAVTWTPQGQLQLASEQVIEEPVVRRVGDDGTTTLVPLAGLRAGSVTMWCDSDRIYVLSDTGGSSRLYVSQDGGYTWDE